MKIQAIQELGQPDIPIPSLVAEMVSMRAAIIDLPAAETQPRRAALIAATSIFFMVIIVSNTRFASAPPTAIASVSTRGVICHETPHLSLHQPQAVSWPPLPTMAFQ